MSVWGALGVLITVLAGVIAVVKYLRGGEQKSAALEVRTAELDEERKRVHQQEEAALAAMRARRESVNEKAARVRGADDAAKLLAEVTGADDPDLN